MIKFKYLKIQKTNQTNKTYMKNFKSNEYI